MHFNCGCVRGLEDLGPREIQTAEGPDCTGELCVLVSAVGWVTLSGGPGVVQ